MKILMVCQHFYPEQFRINDICFELALRGHEVTVLTGLPNYPEGRVFPGYHAKAKRDETVRGVRIIRTFLIGQGTNVLTLGLNYLTFIVSSVLKAKRLAGPFDLVYSYQLSPISMVWPAITVKKRFGIPLILHCLDQWPVSLTAGPFRKDTAVYRWFEKISIRTYRAADVILLSSRSFRKYFETELGITAEEKGLIYYPSYAESDYDNVGSEDNGVFDLVFAGNIGPAQSVETIIECAGYLRERRDIHFHIVGDGLSCGKCRKLAEEMQLTNVTFHGFHPVSDMPAYYRLADAFLITMVDNEVVNSTLPAKIQSYMLAGKPIFGAIGGEVADVVKEAGCGLCTGAYDAKGLADLIASRSGDASSLKEMGEKGRAYYLRHFEKETCIRALEEIFASAAAEKTAAEEAK